MWDYQTGQQLALLRGHAGRGESAQLLAGRTLAGVKHVRKVRSKYGRSTRALDGMVLSGTSVWLQDLDISPDGRHLACVASGSASVNLWDLEKRSRTDLKAIATKQ